MSEQTPTPSETPTPNPTLPSATTETKPLPNDPAARTVTGEIKDAAPIAKPAEPKKDEAASAGAPEKYADFKAPEGTQLEPEAITKASEIFKGMNLSQDQAQALIDFHAGEMARLAKSSSESYDSVRKEWRDEVLKDPSLALNGELKSDVKATMSKAIDSLGPELATKFRDSLNLTGQGDNPAFIRGFYELTKKLAEGTAVTGSGPSAQGQVRPGGSAKPSAAQALFPNLPSSAS